MPGATLDHHPDERAAAVEHLDFAIPSSRTWRCPVDGANVAAQGAVRVQEAHSRDILNS